MSEPETQDAPAVEQVTESDVTIQSPGTPDAPGTPDVDTPETPDNEE